MYIYLYMYVYTFINVCIYIYIHSYVYICICICIHSCIYMYIFTYLYIYTYIYINLYIHEYIYILHDPFGFMLTTHQHTATHSNPLRRNASRNHYTVPAMLENDRMMCRYAPYPHECEEVSRVTYK